MDDSLMDEIANEPYTNQRKNITHNRCQSNSLSINIPPQNYDELYKSFNDEYDWHNRTNIIIDEDLLFDLENLPYDSEIIGDNEDDKVSIGCVIMSSSDYDKHAGSCTSKLHIETEAFTPLENEIKYYSFCCLCGKYDFEHECERHKFFAAFDDHRCTKCNKWFFQHKNMLNPCWKPTKYL